MRSRRTRSRGPRSAGDKCRRPKGFSMIAHCKAIGKLKRTGKKNKGKYIKSPKYRRRKSSRK
jgi:hypothetical protein